MTTVTAIILARLTSSRLPKKHLELIDGTPLIIHVINRLKRLKSIDKIILATGLKEENQELADFVSEYEIETYFDDDVNDVTGRIARAGKKYGSEIIVTISGDCPLIDPEFITEGIKLLKKSYSDYVFVDHSKYDCLHEGIGFHTLEAWEKLDQLSITWFHKEHPGSILKKNQSLLKGVEIVPQPEFQRHDFRMSVDTQSDLFFMNQLYIQSNSENGIVDLHDVVKLIDQKPFLKKINSHVHQKTLTEKSTEILFITYASEKLGMGHLSRCIALAIELKESFALKPIFLINDEEIICKKLDQNKLKYKLIDQEFIEDQIINLINQKSISGIVIDVKYEDLHEKFQLLPNFSIPITLIDNYPEQSFEGCKSIIPAVNTEYPEPQKNVFKGKDYLILNRELQYWRNWDNQSLSGDLLIMSGGSNLPNDFLLKTVQNLIKDIRVSFILGPYADRDKFENKLVKFNINKKNVIQDPLNIFEEIKKAKCVVLPFGVSTYECLVLGKPVIINEVLNPKDVKIVKYLADKHVLFNGLQLSKNTIEFSVHIDKIYQDNRYLKTISENAINYIDGMGVNNIANLIKEELFMQSTKFEMNNS